MIINNGTAGPAPRRLSLRRTLSKPSLAPSRRPSIYHLKSRLHRARARARTFLSRKPSQQTGYSLFTDRLPPEIRVQIYQHLLRFDAPLKPLASGSRCPTFHRDKSLAILRVNRLIHAEALSVLYDLNTFSVPRSAFCTGKTTSGSHARKEATINHDLIRTLNITTLAPSPACATLIADRKIWSALEPCPSPAPCVHCDTCLLPLLRTLRAMPRLRNVQIEYHAHADLIRKLAATLTGTHGRATGLNLTCTGIGTHALAGSAWFPHTTLALRSTPLALAWPVLTAIPPFAAGTGNNPIGYLRSARAQSKPLVAILCARFPDQQMKLLTRKLFRLLVLHDRGVVPREVAGWWPEGVEMDFRGLGARARQGEGEDEAAERERERRELLHRFGLYLDAFCAGVTKRLKMRDVVVRRGFEDDDGLGGGGGSESGLSAASTRS